MEKYIKDLSYSQILEIIAKQTLRDVGGIQDFTFNEALEEISDSEDLVMISPEDILKGERKYYFFIKAEDSFLVNQEFSFAEISFSVMKKKFLIFNCKDNEFLN